MQSQRNSLYMIGLFLLLSHCFPESYGGSAMRELRCQCITTVSTPFHKKHIRSLEVFQKGPHCPRVECDITQWIPTLFKSRCQVVNRCCQKDSQKEFTEEMKTQSSPEFLYYFVLSKV
ncbi:hypothetical protein XELAEV_18005826mg [Xenopus laevis]|uniref:Interleukin-8 n=1 Tax=Xenopus laevis TaxID=8355 RepID=A0A974DY23_XENLA|nr:hypothetical protein XELAEV_18005826mg [Xenopus laevis]